MKIGDTIAVDEFVYLVRYITKHRDELEDIRGIELANDAYHTLLPLVKKREIHRQTKMKMYFFFNFIKSALRIQSILCANVLAGPCL